MAITTGSTSVAESIHDLIGNHYEVAGEHSMRSIQESIHSGVLTGALHAPETMEKHF